MTFGDQMLPSDTDMDHSAQSEWPVVVMETDAVSFPQRRQRTSSRGVDTTSDTTKIA
jgi:hypothetical protein